MESKLLTILILLINYRMIDANDYYFKTVVALMKAFQLENVERCVIFTCPEGLKDLLVL